MRDQVYWLVFFILTFLIISLVLNIILLFRFIWKNESSKSRRLAQNISLSVFTFLVVLMLVEFFFKVFFAQSDEFNYTLASKNWIDRYWRENSLGYRDREWTPELLKGRTKIMVLGDSFVAGIGIENEADRFSDLLGQRLDENYAVMNVGSNGANTKDEIQNALAYPYTPDVIILSFYINDIQSTAKDMGFKQPTLQTTGPFLVNYSYALNFFYWRIYRLGPQEWNNQYWDWLLSLYHNPDIWRVYQGELLQIADFIKQRKGRLIVVVFPHLLAVEESQPITSRVVKLYTDRGVPVVNVTEMVAGMNPTELIASPVDAHPNEFVHHLVAEKLYQLVLDSQRISDK
ncbi:MAG: SGNH/GDSL hydrolase family protein [Chloroflexi bacterium]|nr:SGNH/GDSL hydrolase family protein [Chloroflexota bacterium]